MEKTTTILKENKTATINELLSLSNRNTLHLSGILEVISTSDNELYLKLKDTTLSITGTNIHISKLDVQSGDLEATGNFDSIKYGKSKNIFKRLFK